MSRALRFLPLILLVAVLGAMIWRLANPADSVIRSKLEGKPVPAFTLPAAVPGKPGLASATLATGNPRLLNIFASWCVPCIGEAPVLDQLKRRGVQIDAIAIRDRPADVARFLFLHGDPFARIGSDTDSRVQLELGSSGVPETFVIDGKGIIRYQHVGPIEHDQIPMILAELEKAE
ncbi:MAG TPA: DsbE family thiol:disulfide interchange protein [Sphingomicrobium sp.]|nr:DsbE family thiol:disulfide interchange protein [Sphingomicrobium sp.]